MKKDATILRQCPQCATVSRGPKNPRTEAEVAAVVEASRKAHARTKAGRACPSQIKHRHSSARKEKRNAR